MIEITKDNVMTWNDIIYSWILNGARQDYIIDPQDSKYGRCMTIANRLVKMLTKEMKRELKTKKELKIG